MTQSTDPIRTKHFANIGDVIATLPGLRKYYQKTGRKIIFCQQLNVLADYYPGATHPVRDDAGQNKMVMMNSKMWAMLTPLLLAQDYIAGAEVWTGQKVSIDIDQIRKKINVNLPNGAIQQWLFMLHPDLATDISKPWVYIKDDVDISSCKLSYPSLITTELPLSGLEGKAIINFTQRYRNHHLSYYFLRQYADRLIFAGTEEEKSIFCEQWGLDIPLIKIDNFLQLGAVLKKCKFLLSNQSFMWNLAEAMKTPRILEICDYAANCQAFIGEDSFGYLHQPDVEFYVNEMFE